MRKSLAILITAMTLVMPGWAMDFQADTAQVELAKKHKSQWQAEDRDIALKLDKLRKKNDRPNIVFILSDDIGWGELGSYGGGKLRGTPTPNLDKLADDGMRFLQHYSEPSCTVTRIALMTGRLPIRTGVDNVLFPGNPNRSKRNFF